MNKKKLFGLLVAFVGGAATSFAATSDPVAAVAAGVTTALAYLKQPAK